MSLLCQRREASIPPLPPSALSLLRSQPSLLMTLPHVWREARAAVPGTVGGRKRRRERTDRQGGRECYWHLPPGHLLKGWPERDAPARHKTDRDRERGRMALLYLENVSVSTRYCPTIYPLSVCLALSLFWKQPAQRRRGDKEERGIKGGCTVLSGLLASQVRKHVLLFRIRGDTMAGAELFLLYLYYRLLAGAWLCLELWELCALFCKSKRQAGDKQDSPEHSETGCVSLWVYLCTLLPLLFNHCDLARPSPQGHCFLSHFLCRIFKMPPQYMSGVIKQIPSLPAAASARAQVRGISVWRGGHSLWRLLLVVE